MESERFDRLLFEIWNTGRIMKDKKSLIIGSLKAIESILLNDPADDGVTLVGLIRDSNPESVEDANEFYRLCCRLLSDISSD